MSNANSSIHLSGLFTLAGNVAMNENLHNLTQNKNGDEILNLSDFLKITFKWIIVRNSKS